MQRRTNPSRQFARRHAAGGAACNAETRVERLGDRLQEAQFEVIPLACLQPVQIGDQDGVDPLRSRALDRDLPRGQQRFTSGNARAGELAAERMQHGVGRDPIGVGARAEVGQREYDEPRVASAKARRVQRPALVRPRRRALDQDVGPPGEPVEASVIGGLSEIQAHGLLAEVRGGELEADACSRPPATPV